MRREEQALAGLKGKYCIVGIGETGYSRNSGRSTRDLGAEAVRRAMDDAGLHPWDVDGMLNWLRKTARRNSCPASVQTA